MLQRFSTTNGTSLNKGVVLASDLYSIPTIFAVCTNSFRFSYPGSNNSTSTLSPRQNTTLPLHTLFGLDGSSEWISFKAEMLACIRKLSNRSPGVVRQ